MIGFPAVFRALAVVAGAALLAPVASPAQAAAAQQPAAAPPARPGSTPEQLAIRAASASDRQRMMSLLGIKELRPGADYRPGQPGSANFDESKADTHLPLPNPLVLNNGKPVTSAQMWWTERRPQIVKFFDEDVLGREPARLPAVLWQVENTTRESVAGLPVVTQKLIGHVDNSADPAITVNIQLILTVPAHAPGLVPVIMELAFPKEFDPAWQKGSIVDVWPPAADSGPSWQQQVLARGWGYAMLSPYSYQADNGAGLRAGIIGLANHGRPRNPGDWGVLRAWAWGASRALDYFATDPEVDAHQVGIMGHSRMGKTALVAMAYDNRFAIAYISSSGEGGAKLYRHHFGEEIGNLAGPAEYHWMAGNFLKYDGPLTVGALPVDAHELIALCAPRPVFIGAGAAMPALDGWADPQGEFDAAVAAGPVYRLLGKKCLGTNVFPSIGTPLTSGDIAFRQHSGGHTPTPNWPAFLQFASRYLAVKTGPVLAANPPR